MSIFCINFSKQFVPLVESGQKLQTIRANRADGRVPRVGDTAKLYSGLRTKATRQLGIRTVVECYPVHIDFETRPATVIVNGERLDSWQLNEFAKLDGFRSGAEMLGWFKHAHPVDTFEGWCVRWNPKA